jgi:hypothetical protein
MQLFNFRLIDCSKYDTVFQYMKWSIKIIQFGYLLCSIYIINLNFIKHNITSMFILTWLISVWLSRKLKAYRQTLESVPGTNQYWAMSVKVLVQGNNGPPLTGFELTRKAILRLLVKRDNHPAMLKSQCWFNGCTGHYNDVALSIFSYYINWFREPVSAIFKCLLALLPLGNLSFKEF